MKQKTEGLHIRVSPKMAERLRQSVAKCGRGMSQGLFLERCFEIGCKAVTASFAQHKEPTQEVMSK